MENKIKQIIRKTVNEAFDKERKRRYVKKIVSEELKKKLKEATKGKTSTDMKRKSVMTTLKDPKYNHAQLAYDLYHPQDQGEKDTVRSLFSKKASGKPDNSGSIRSFNDEEINKLYQLIRKK